MTASVTGLLSEHGWAIILTFCTNYVWGAFVSSLPAPTRESTKLYQFLFKFLNVLAANVNRAKSTSIEGSPNWIPAVERVVEVVQATGMTPIPPGKKSHG